VVGLKYNFTLFVVNDSVTWYTARDVCDEEIKGSTFDIYGTDCCNYFTNKLAEMNLYV